MTAERPPEETDSELDKQLTALVDSVSDRQPKDPWWLYAMAAVYIVGGFIWLVAGVVHLIVFLASLFH